MAPQEMVMPEAPIIDRAERTDAWNLAALVEQIVNGDSKALISFYDQTSGLLYGLIQRILGDRTEADEVLLDVYTHAWRHAKSADFLGGEPIGWLIHVARAKAIERNRQFGSSGKASPISEADEQVASHEKEAGEMEKCGSLLKASIAALNSAQQAMLDLAYYQGMNHCEIAELLGTTPAEVREQLRQGMIRLSDLLRPPFRQEKSDRLERGGQES